MVTAEFFLYANIKSDVLVHVKSRIRIKLYPLDCVDFHPLADQHHIYARFDNKCLAFEASDFSVLWYSRYLDTKMEIFLHDPRVTATPGRSKSL